MNEQILINVTPQETRVALTEQGSVQELHIERASSRGLVGNIYLGRVCRVLPGIGSPHRKHRSYVPVQQRLNEDRHENQTNTQDAPLQYLPPRRDFGIRA